MKKKRSTQSQAVGLGTRAKIVSGRYGLRYYIFRRFIQPRFISWYQKPAVKHLIIRHPHLGAVFIWVFEQTDPDFLARWLRRQAARYASRRKEL